MLSLLLGYELVVTAVVRAWAGGGCVRMRAAVAGAARARRGAARVVRNAKVTPK